MVADVFLHADLPFPKSLPGFQKLFPDDAACATYLEKIRWEGGFSCPHCKWSGEPFRFAARPHVLRCRKCRANRLGAAGAAMSAGGSTLYGIGTPRPVAPAPMMTCTRSGPYLNCF